MPGIGGGRALPNPNRGLCFHGGAGPVFRSAPSGEISGLAMAGDTG